MQPAVFQNHAKVANEIVDDEIILATDPDDEEMNALVGVQVEIDRTIMSLPARCWADVEAKLGVWRGLIAEPGCLHLAVQRAPASMP